MHTWSAKIKFVYLVFVLLIAASTLSIALAFPLTLAVLAGCIYLLIRNKYLRTEEGLNSSQVNVGLFLLTVSVLLFPGMIIIPALIETWFNKPGFSLYAWFSLIGLIVAIPSIPIGVVLVLFVGPKKTHKRKRPIRRYCEHSSQID